ncbi:DUF5719 family protein [Quadrisphaera sp. INWT6]|uniref:DUF5719 family protein n=1 Tax=Quadrisphaera sp. INWT6 TaxID=2596917 RepID=UPI002815DA81|nr:DUF5719 family protein [Quadrisphaera sp. INWT6]
MAGGGASLSATALAERPAAGGQPAAAPAATPGEALGDLLRVRPAGTATAAGTGTALAAGPVDGGAPVLAGTTTSLTGSGDLRGLSTPACAAPAEQTWLVGGSTGVGRSTRLVLADAGSTPTTVDVTVLTASGPQQPDALQGLSLGPGEQRSVLLEGVLEGIAAQDAGTTGPGGGPLAVQVRSSAGPVSAWLVEGVLRGLVPGGTEVVGPAAAPATSLLVPGVVTAGSAPAVLRVANPGAEPVVARFSVVGTSGSAVPSGAVPATAVPAGSAVDVELPALPAGGVALAVEADGPVLAAVRTDSAPGSGTPGDLAWAPAAEPLRGRALVALPPAAPGSSGAPDARLVLTSREAAAVDVAIVGADGRTGQARRVELPASTTTAADVDDLVRSAGGSGSPVALLLTPVAGQDGHVVAALSSRAAAGGGGDLVSTTAVSPGSAAPSTVAVAVTGP